MVAAYLLATAAFEEGRHCQAFPTFGAERRGAPVTAFVRIADKPIRRRCQVAAPGFLIVQDAGLLELPGVTEGLRPGGGIVVNDTRPPEELERLTGRPTLGLPAARLALEILGRPMPNVALLAAFLTITGLLPVTALEKALGHRFKGEVLEKNRRLIDAVVHTVPTGGWREAADAASA